MRRLCLIDFVVMVGCFLAFLPGAPLEAQTPTAPATASAAVPTLRGQFGTPATFADFSQFAGYGYAWGPSDGQFGAMALTNGTYRFLASAGSGPTCAGTPKANGEYAFIGTLEHPQGSACSRLFGPGDGPAGWIFDKDYAGGGDLVRFAVGNKRGWFIPFHGEYHWQNPNTTTHWCDVGGNTGSQVPCFYSGIGLAVSTDEGKTFQIVGQLMQPAQPISVFTGGGKNLNVGYGSLVVADASGKHIDNPPADPSSAYFYLFFMDFVPNEPGVCGLTPCIGLARAPYADVVNAALSGNPDQVAKVFHKYDGASPDPWTEPATSDTPDQTGTAGKAIPLWTDDPGIQPSIIYDKAFNVYLAAYQLQSGIRVRASNDLIHWSEPIATLSAGSGNMMTYVSILGETGDPTIGGPSPRLYYMQFPVGAFPNYKTSTFETVTLTLMAE
jgi:hypothetical protein